MDKDRISMLRNSESVSTIIFVWIQFSATSRVRSIDVGDCRFDLDLILIYITPIFKWEHLDILSKILYSIFFNYHYSRNISMVIYTAVASLSLRDSMPSINPVSRSSISVAARFSSQLSSALNDSVRNKKKKIEVARKILTSFC